MSCNDEVSIVEREELDQEDYQGAERLRNVPEPLCEGWIRRLMDDGSWKRRYYVLFPDLDGGGPTLFVFVNSLVADTMKRRGVQTQQSKFLLYTARSLVLMMCIGYLRVRLVTIIQRGSTERGDVVLLHSAESKVWTLLPDKTDHYITVDNVERWMAALTPLIV